MSGLNVERTRHWRECPTCEGAGEIFVRHPLYGSSSCPYDGDDEPCPNAKCEGGEIVEWVDPLIRMRNARRDPLLRTIGAYTAARRSAMRPVLLPPDFARRDRNVVIDVLAPAFAAALRRTA